MSNKACPGQFTNAVYFVADLHLDPERAEAFTLARSFFEQLPDSSSLYILGDLFEYWIGDDAGIELYAEIISALAALEKRQCTTFVMHGNRDFLLGESFAKAAHVTLVCEDELLISVHGSPVLLMHGDTLCIDDEPYQAFRQTVRDTHWQAAFLEKSVSERLAYAQHLRAQSSEQTAQKTQTIMDVNETCVHERLAAHNCAVMIHGHTHRPAVHHSEDSQSYPRHFQRLVVGDWHSTHAQYVVHDKEGLHLKRFDSESCTPSPSA